jgi:uncharacterized membrane protein YfcA
MKYNIIKLVLWIVGYFVTVIITAKILEYFGYGVDSWLRIIVVFLIAAAYVLLLTRWKERKWKERRRHGQQ